MPSGRNQFELVCDRASAENWCWNIACTTCGHMMFRYAFKELVTGVHPQADSWVTRSRNQRRLSTLLGEMPRRLTTDDQMALGSILASADLNYLSTNTPLPDWLGYLGLGLCYTEETESMSRLLTLSWGPQLLEFLPGESSAHKLLSEIIHDDRRCLRWTDLESVEIALMLQRHRQLMYTGEGSVG